MTVAQGNSAAAPQGTPAPAAAATPPAAASAPAPTTNDINPGAWMAGFNEDLKGYASTKGWKDPGQLAESYRNLEKLAGVPQDRLMKLPEKFYDDAGKLTAEGRAIYERLGTPKDAKDYDLKVPETGGDPKLMEHFKTVFHDAGVPKNVAEKIVGSWNEYQGKAVEATKAQAVEAFKQSEIKLKSDWGMAFDQNVNIAKEAVRALGVSAEQINAISSQLGHDATMKLFHKFGSAVGESTFVTGRPTGTMLEPASAKARISALKSDKAFAARLMSKDASATSEWESLHQQAYPGSINVR